MNKGQKVLAGLLGVVVAELAVLDYAAYQIVRNGMSMEISVDELGRAKDVFEEDAKDEGITILNEE